MMNTMRNGHFMLFAALAAVILFAVTPARAVPADGEAFQFRQPDGSLVSVRVFGDEFYRDMESPDGYTLVRDASGWLCYAELSADGGEYVPAGGRYTGAAGGAPAAARKGLRISDESAHGKRRRGREALGYYELTRQPAPVSRKTRFMPAAPNGISHAPAATEPQKIVGLTVLIDFPDQPSSFSEETINEFLNRKGGIGGTADAGSVYDYFYDVSGGLFEYTNVITPFITADSNKAYYENDPSINRARALDLVRQSLNKLNDMNFDLSGVTTQDGIIVAANILYAGRRTSNGGLWPHARTVMAQITAGGINVNKYQMSDIDDGRGDMSIGTFVHENGHMLMGWPDLYYGDNGRGTEVVRNYCLMGANDNRFPQMPNPYFRDIAGWIDVIDIAGIHAAPPATLTHAANSHSAYRYSRNGSESYYIEARTRTGRSAWIAGEGLMIWHIHADGENFRPTDSYPFPLVKVVRANDPANTETPFPTAPAGSLGWVNAPFRADGGSNNTSFSSASSPAARYHDGTLSDINITGISAVGETMSFDIVSNTSAVYVSSREIRGDQYDNVAAAAPVHSIAGEFTASRNPASRSSGHISFFRHGERIKTGVLTVYDAMGNAVNKISISDNSTLSTPSSSSPESGNSNPRRVVGSWDLKDARGRPVSEGAYLLRGVVVTVDGRRERVSVMIGVR